MQALHDFEDTLFRLNELDTWLASLGFATHNRIRRYRAHIEKMINLEKRGGIEEYAETLSDQETREILWSYVEGEEFVRAVEPLRHTLAENFILTPIAQALNGPVDLASENQFNNEGRNFMFELIMGGRLAKAGYPPLFGAGPDVRFDFAGLKVGVQCKRPLTEGGIEQNIRKAIVQLKSDKSELGLIAVSLSRLFANGNPDDILTVSSADQAHAVVLQKLELLAEATRRFWDGRIERSGLYLYAFVPVRWLQSSGRFGHTMVRRELLVPPPNDHLTSTLFRCLTQALGK